MSEARNALGGAVCTGLVTVTESPPTGMILLRGDLSSNAVVSAVRHVSGLAMPGPLQARLDGELGLLWMAPDELLILLPHGSVAEALASLTRALADDHALIVDLSDARSVFTLTGPDVRDVVAKLSPIDVGEAAFSPGTFRRTRFAQVAAGVWMQDPERVSIICFRSVAQYMFDLLRIATDPDARVDYH